MGREGSSEFGGGWKRGVSRLTHHNAHEVNPPEILSGKDMHAHDVVDGTETSPEDDAFNGASEHHHDDEAQQGQPAVNGAAMFDRACTVEHDLKETYHHDDEHQRGKLR